MPLSQASLPPRFQVPPQLPTASVFFRPYASPDGFLLFSALWVFSYPLDYACSPSHPHSVPPFLGSCSGVFLFFPLPRILVKAFFDPAGPCVPQRRDFFSALSSLFWSVRLPPSRGVNMLFLVPQKSLVLPQFPLPVGGLFHSFFFFRSFSLTALVGILFSPPPLDFPFFFRVSSVQFFFIRDLTVSPQLTTDLPFAFPFYGPSFGIRDFCFVHNCLNAFLRPPPRGYFPPFAVPSVLSFVS